MNDFLAHILIAHMQSQEKISFADLQASPGAHAILVNVGAAL